MTTLEEKQQAMKARRQRPQRAGRRPFTPEQVVRAALRYRCFQLAAEGKPTASIVSRLLEEFAFRITVGSVNRWLKGNLPLLQEDERPSTDSSECIDESVVT